MAEPSPSDIEAAQQPTTYDAVYVALAETLGTALVTCDARTARAPGLRCDVQLLGQP